MMFFIRMIPSRSSARILLLLMLTFPAYSYASTPLENYQALKNLQHLNTEKNRDLVNQLMIEASNEEYQFLQAPIYAYIARLKTNDGNWLEGKHYLDKAVSTISTIKNNDLLIDALESISWIFFIRGDYSEAILYVQKMAEHAYETANQRGQIVALNRLALSYIELDLYELAIEPLELALKLARKTKNYDSEFLATLYLISARINLDDVDPNETLALTLVAERIPSKFNSDDGYLPRLKGVVNEQLGNFDVAEKWFKLSESRAKSSHDVRLLQIVSLSLSELYLKTNQLWIALDYAITSLEYNSQLQHANTQATLHYLLSNIYQQLGDDKNSLKFLRAYADYQNAASDKGTVSLISTMDKRIENIKRQQKLAQLENSLLSSKVTSQKNKNKQQVFIFIIIALALFFCFFIIVFFVHHRMLKTQIVSSMKDELTGVFCRSYLKNYLPAVKSRFERETNQELSLGAVIIDCDDFKFINDTFGHAGGDKALKAIVNTIKTQIRKNDLLLRWGGDEFVLICESVSQVQIQELAKRITRSISDLLIEYDETTLTVTISAGFALHDKTEDFNFDGLIKAADEFLLATKKRGKNSYLGDNFTELSQDNYSNNFS
ncbi:tetratricopeptide repeat-containing diguanylate cyclase [Cognaticolwellia mytili]|uniref:tetratricopeptide repeat-containing diguanylate cyclase n=1 Tax=Cognaticolwellia mytili TaxID=1888913 RepID=UPI001301E92F|nr:GGDEF domain-containing protein [Cognaticolwellia mytili]